MTYISFLDSSRPEVMADASGYHRVGGTVFLAETIGAEPNHQNYLRQVLGRGEWHRVRSVYWEGLNVPSTHYRFFKGDENATPSEWFPRDSAHPNYVLGDVKVPQTGLGTPIKKGADVEKAVFFCETGLFPDFDANGNQIDENGNLVSAVTEELDASAFFYTVNPANVLVGWLLTRANHVYTRSSINWAKYVSWRDFMAGLETVDYRVVPRLDGFGLTVRFFTDTSFTTEVVDSKRIDPYINFESSTGAPALGITADNFSARYEGFVKPKFTEEYTFTIQHNDSAKLWIDDVFLINEGSAGTHTATANLTADQFHKIQVDWANSSGTSELILKWQSANTPLQVIKTEHFYPRVEQMPRYEAHVAIISSASPAFVIPLMMRITNSVCQKVNGKLVFECLEQKTPGFTLLESDIIRVDGAGLSATWERTKNDIQSTEAYDVYEGVANDLDERYLYPIQTPVRFYADPDNTPEQPKVKTIVFTEPGLFSVNMRRWQIFKILKFLMAREASKDLKIELETNLRTYPIQAGDILPVNLEAINAVNKTFLVTETTDSSPEEAKSRKITLKEWFPQSEFQTEMELST